MVVSYQVLLCRVRWAIGGNNDETQIEGDGAEMLLDAVIDTDSKSFLSADVYRRRGTDPVTFPRATFGAV